MELIKSWKVKSNLKTEIVKLSLCNYREGCILVKATIKINGAGVDEAARVAYEGNQQLIFKTYVPVIDCITESNSIQADDAKLFLVVMSMYNLI